LASDAYSPGFISAIDWALEFLPENRPQSIDEWRAVLAGRATRPPPTVTPNVTTDFARAAPTEVHPQAGKAISARDSAAPSAATGSGSQNRSVPASGRVSAPRPGKSTSRATPGMVATDRIAPPASAPDARGGAREPNAREHRGIGRRVAEVTAVGLIIAAMGAWYLLTQPTERVPSRKPIATIEPSEKVPSAELLAASKVAEQEAALAKTRAKTEYERKRADIEHLLRQATADRAADRLMTPPDKNAFSRYRAVLALDPANEAALQGLHAILTRYLALSKSAANDNSFEVARGYLDKAAVVSAGAESIAAARAAIDTRETAHQVERQRTQSEARKAAEEQRQSMAAARRATEAERKRLEAATRAADQERRRITAEREAEIERQRLDQEAIVQTKLEADFKIAALLGAAQEAFEANRLTAPANDNALASFKSVQTIDPDNAEADAGIQRIAERYVQLAEEDIAAYRFDKAESLIDEANTIYAGIPSIVPARQKLRGGRAAYDGRRPISNPPFRMTMPPVTGTNTCTAEGIIEDPMSEVENFGARSLRGDGDLVYVPTSTTVDNTWEDSGINKEPRGERLYVLGNKEKLDGALMYWYSAIGTQCYKVQVDAYLVDLQTRTVYAQDGPKSDLQDMTETLIDQFKNGRRALGSSASTP
jgi:hypothetical protein